jgi:ribose transport system ATP-binding protein
MTSAAGPDLLRAKGLSKSYPGVQALSQVDFDIHVGEVHALVGENGAGKSTLSGILTGLVAPDDGSMWLEGAAYQPPNKRRAELRCVQIVMQELNLVGNLTVAESIFVGKFPHRYGVINYPELNRAAAGIMAEVGLDGVAPTTPVKSLGTGQQQMVEIAAALSRQCRLLILDEPTASLTDKETDLLFEHVRELKGRGVGVLYTSHRMDEIRRIADRITVLRDGERVATLEAAQTTIGEVIRLMVGREIEDEPLRRQRSPGPVALKVVGLSRGDKVRDVGFCVHKGEIFGFAGLMGSGRTETMRALCGVDRSRGGKLFLRGSDRPAVIRSPRDAVRSGIAFLTENRKEEGLLMGLPLRANITVTDLPKVSRFGWIRRAREDSTARKYTEALSVTCSSLEQAVNHLSGGNQQKVVLAKWLYRDCDVMIIDEPTRGIDVGAKFEIYQLLADLASQGKAIILVSSELDELMTLCDRIGVMSDGRLVKTMKTSEWSKETLLKAAYEEYLEPQPGGTRH